MGLHLRDKRTGRKWWMGIYPEEGVVLVLGCCFLLAVTLVLFYPLLYPGLENAPKERSEEQWQSTDGSIKFTMICELTERNGDPEGIAYDAKPLGEIKVDGEVIPVRVTFRSHDPIMRIYKDTNRVRKSKAGYRQDALLKYECKYRRGGV